MRSTHACSTGIRATITSHSGRVRPKLICKALAASAGLDPTRPFETLIPSAFQIAAARRSQVFQGGDFGGGGLWFIYGNAQRGASDE